MSYEQGRTCKDPSKLPIPACAYLHVLRKDDFFALSEVIRMTTWEDDVGSYNHPGYLGPPVAEFAPYKKIPTAGKRKEDARQGTIDQDPEFMDFLEQLANPPHPQAEDRNERCDDGLPVAGAEVTTTPLIQALRERKKAARAREAANMKNPKQSQASSAKEKKKAKDKDKDKDKEKKNDKPKETVKILTKKAAQEAAAGVAKNVAAQIAVQAHNTAEGASSAASTQQPATSQKSRRAGIAAAARILQRDLGISPGSAHRRARLDAQKAEAEAKAAAAAKEAAAPPLSKPEQVLTKKHSSRPSTPTAPKAQQHSAQNTGKRGKAKQQSNTGSSGGGDSGKAKNTGSSKEQARTPPTPVILLRKDRKQETETQLPQVPTGPSAVVTPSRAPASTTNLTPSASAPPPTAPTGPKAGPKSAKVNAAKGGQKKPNVPQVAPGATRAFVKHANPSQGVTEPLLKAALEKYGNVTFVEIDRRKGFAYVNFAAHDGLVKAISASPVSVAQAAVLVLERRDKPTAQKTGGSQVAAAEKSGKGHVGKNEKAGDGKCKTQEVQHADQAGGGTCAVPTAAAGGDEVEALLADKPEGGGNVLGGGSGSGKNRIRRAGRARGSRGKDGGAKDVDANNNASGPVSTLGRQQPASTSG